MSVRSHISAMAGYTPGEQPQAGKFIKLNTNENPYPASPKVRAAIEQAMGNLSRYPDSMATAFRRRAADLLGVDPDWILCGNGSDDILTILTRGFVGEGELLRLPYPSYVLYHTLAQIQGARAEDIPFNADWSLPAAFAAEGCKLAFVPNPNSPSGTLIAADQLAELAGKLSCPLVIDEAYVDFAESDCIHLVKEHENVLVTRTLSKSYALAGLRFGFLIARPEIITELTKVKDSYNCDMLSIAGATAAINDQAWLAENRAKIIATRVRMETMLAELGFEVTPSQANFIWCRHNNRPSRELYLALKEQRVLVRYMDYPGYGDGLRISVGTDDQIDALETILQTLV